MDGMGQASGHSSGGNLVLFDLQSTGDAYKGFTLIEECGLDKFLVKQTPTLPNHCRDLGNQDPF